MTRSVILKRFFQKVSKIFYNYLHKNKPFNQSYKFRQKTANERYMCACLETRSKGHKIQGLAFFVQKFVNFLNFCKNFKKEKHPKSLVIYRCFPWRAVRDTSTLRYDGAKAPN